MPKGEQPIRALEVGPGGIIKQEFPEDKGAYSWRGEWDEFVILLVTPEEYRRLTGEDPRPLEQPLHKHEKATRLGTRGGRDTHHQDVLSIAEHEHQLPSKVPFVGVDLKMLGETVMGRRDGQGPGVTVTATAKDNRKAKESGGCCTIL